MAMARRFVPSNMAFYDFGRYEKPTHFKKISTCFIRKDHTCDKYIGASKSCFIACPSTPEVKIMTGLITEKLSKIGVEPVVAIDLRAYGQDIFCTKICGKIIEAQFCIAILDDIPKSSGGKDTNTPNPNVYYEYGLMTALGKYVIPLQKEGQSLAFNIKAHDTIKYTPDNLSVEIDLALKDATKITEEEREAHRGEIVPVRMYGSFLAINGYHKMGYGWFLREELEDTLFVGYKNDRRSEYVFFTVIDDKEMLKTCIIDIQVITKRLEGRLESLLNEIESTDEGIEKLKKDIEAEEKGGEMLSRRVPPGYRFGNREMSSLMEKREDASDKVELIKNSKFAVILAPDLLELKDKCTAELNGITYDTVKIPTYFGDTSGINIEDVEIEFKAPTL